MMLEFIRLTERDTDLHKEVFDILKETGRNMYESEGLKHWLNPYPLSKIIDDIKTKNVFLVKRNSMFVATFMLSKTRTPFFDDEKGFYYLSKFAVLPSWSSKGIGTKCIKFIDELTLKNDYNGIRLDVYEKSEKAINFYHKNGFTKLFTASTKHFTVVCMEKRMIKR